MQTKDRDVTLYAQQILGQVRQVVVGKDPVLLWGPGGMSVEEVAQAVGTINYELTSLVTKRVPRVYVEEEEL